MTSTIEWTNRHDWNPIRGCTRASEGCRNCYAEIMAARFSGPGQWGEGFASIIQTPAGPDHRWTGKVELQEDRLTLPLRWRKGEPGKNKCFITSTSDPFHESLPDEAIDRLFAVMALRPDWIFQVLTKRSARMREYFSRFGQNGTPHRIDGAMQAIAANDRAAMKRYLEWQPVWPLPNVWLGVSVEDQQRAEERIPDLLATPAAVRWISAEPLLGSLELGSIEQWSGSPDLLGVDMIDCLTGEGLTFDEDGEVAGSVPIPKLDWVVTGGESGPRHRDNNFEANARSLRDQCAAAGVAFFGKQGLWHWPDAETEGFA